MVTKSNAEIQCEIISLKKLECSKHMDSASYSHIGKSVSPEKRGRNETLQGSKHSYTKGEADPSEIDLDKYLLGSRQNSKESVNSSKILIEDERCHSNIIVDPFDKTKAKPANPKSKVVSNQLLHPFCKRSNTCERESLIKESKSNQENGKETVY